MLLARLARFLYRHRWLTIGLWLVLALLSLPLAPRLPGLVQAGGLFSADMESERAHQAMVALAGQPRDIVLVVVASETLTLDDLPFQTFLQTLAIRLSGLPGVRGVITPDLAPSQVAPDRRTVYLTIQWETEALPHLAAVEEILAELTPPGLRAYPTGGAVAYRDLIAVSERDLRRAEIIGLPLAALALLFAFGSLIAAGLPALSGGLSVLISLALLTLVAALTPLSVFVLNLVTMLGLGLGTDYALMLTARFREELAQADVPLALERTLQTAGHAVFFSGLAVLIGLSGLLALEFMMLRSVGLAGVLVVAVSLLAGLTLVPAVLAVLGRRVFALPAPRLWRWTWTPLQGSADLTARHPLAMVAGLGLIIALLGAPFLRARVSLPDASLLPPDLPSRQGADRLEQAFGPGVTSPILVVVQAPGSLLEPARLRALFDLTRYLGTDPEVVAVESIVDLDPRLTLDQYLLLYREGGRFADPYARAALAALGHDRATVVIVTPRHGATSAETQALVRRIRALQPGADLALLVGGAPAVILDVVDRLYTAFPLVIAFVLVTTYIAVLALLRAPVLALKAVLMNILSLSASYGVMVLVFQEGWLSGPLGFRPPGFVDAVLPILLFCVLFGLSMDYEVFLLSRMREEYLRTGDNRTSIATGLARSGRVVASAAMVVVLVSSAFVAAEVVLVKALGLGVAVAVLLDATVIRSGLVPATMHLLGHLNWWRPVWRARRPATVSR